MSLFMELSPEQLGAKLKFINNYIQPTNAADVSLVDANANIAQKNVATLAQEIHKDVNVQLNRALMTNIVILSFIERNMLKSMSPNFG